MGKALEQAGCRVIIIESLAQRCRGDLDAPTCVVRTLRHLVPKRAKAEIRREPIVFKSTGKVGMRHHIEVERAFACRAPCVYIAIPYLANPQIFPNMQVGTIVNPSEGGVGRIRALNGPGIGSTCGARVNVTGLACPVHAAQAHGSACAPAFDEGLAALIPIAFKSVDELHAGYNLHGKLACGIEGGVVRGKVRLGHLNFACRVHTGRKREMVGRDHHGQAGGSGGADVVLKRCLSIREFGVRVAIDQRTCAHGRSLIGRMYRIWMHVLCFRIAH